MFSIAIPLFPNKFWLPLNFMITFIPFKEIFDFYWIVNYLYQVIFTSICMVFYVAYIPMIMITMNHSCWILDSILHKVDQLEVGSETFLHSFDIEKKLSDISVSLADFISWHENSINTLKFNFLLEFSILSTMIGFCMKSMTKDFFYSYPALMGLCVLTSQLFVYGWLGSRVITRYGALTSVLYNIKWHTLSISQRKNLRFILMMSQHLKEFHGVFKSVDLATVQKVKLHFFSKINKIHCSLFPRLWSFHFLCML